MLQDARIVKVNVCGCEAEGDVIISIGNLSLRCYVQMEKSEIFDNFIVGSSMPVDLWLVYGKWARIDNNKKLLAKDLKVCGGTIYGKVTEILSKEEKYLRLESELTIDVHMELADDLPKVGDWIAATGTYQVYPAEGPWRELDGRLYPYN